MDFLCIYNLFDCDWLYLFNLLLTGVPIKLDDIIEEEDVPKVIVKETNGKTETLMRHVSQMLLRGEQIAIIVVIHW